MPDSNKNPCLSLDGGKLSAGGPETHISPPLRWAGDVAPLEPTSDPALAPLVGNLRNFFTKIDNHLNITYKRYIDGRTTLDPEFFTGVGFNTLLQNFATEVFPQSFEYIDAKEFFSTVNIENLVQWFWWAINQGPNKDGDVELVVPPDLPDGRNPFQEFIISNVLKNPEFFYPVVAPDAGAGGGGPATAAIRLAIAMGPYSGPAADPPTVNVQICDALNGAGADGNTQNCVLPYLGTFGGRVQNWPNVRENDVIRVAACPDPTYPLMAVGAEYLDDPIHTEKLWNDALGLVPVGWEEVTEARDRFVVGVGTDADFDGHGNPNAAVNDVGGRKDHGHDESDWFATAGGPLSSTVSGDDLANHVPPFLARYFIRRVN